MLAGLPQQALRHDELDVAPGDEDLLEAVLHAADAVGDEGEAGAVEEGFLHAGDEAEPEVLAHLAELAQEVEVEDQLVVIARPQVVQQLVHDQQQPVIRVRPMERGHHLLEAPLAAGDFGDARKGERDTERAQTLLELADDDVAQGHRGRTDLRADDLEPAGQFPSGFLRRGMGELRDQIAMLGDGGNDRHQV